MRLFSASLMVFFLSVASCWGQVNERTKPATGATSVSASKENPGQSELTSKPNRGMSNIRSMDESIRQKLDQPCNLNYEETPWREIEEELEKEYGINIVLTSSARDDSLTPDEPITQNLTGISARNALRIMLRQKNATFIVKEGVMKIISLDDADDLLHFSTVFINVRPLLSNIATLEKARIGKPRIAKATKTGKSENQPVEMVTAESLLTDLVLETFQQDQWQETGQGQATFNIIGGYAVVNCNEESADGLRSFLTDLTYHLSQD